MKILSLLGLALAAALTGCAAVPQTPERQLVAAVRGGNASLVEKLLSEGAQPDSMTIGYAEYYGRADIVKIVIDYCLRIYEHGKNCKFLPGHIAGKGDAATLKSLLAKGVDVNETDVNGAPLLVYATSAGNAANAKFLIARGADIDLALQNFESSNAKLAAINSPAVPGYIATNNAAIAMLNRFRPAGTGAAPAAGGVTKAEMAEMLKAAVASAQPAATPAPKAAEAEYHSDVDAPTYKVAQNPDAYALVVGVEKYNTLPEARFAERDAKAMNAHLLAMGYPQRNIVLLTGPQATKTGLLKNLEAWLPNNVTARSTVFFYFSGHGAPDPNSSQAYLVPADGDPQYLAETAYPVKRLYEKLGALKAKRVLVALDSCFSGAGGRSVIASGTRPLVGKLKTSPMDGKIVALSASASDEITGAAEDQGHGLFTYQLLKAIAETAGRGTVAEIYAALKPRVEDEARRQNRGQTPQLSGSAVDAGLR